MTSPLLDRMKQLCALPGPPGREGAVRDAIAETLKPAADALRTDAFGNLIAHHRAVDTVPHLLIQCHMDEVGLVVLNVEPGGAIRFEKVGLVADAVLPAREVDLLAEDGSLHRGVINVRSGHLQSLHGQEHPTASEMWIDLGAVDGEAVKGCGIGPGTPGVFHSPFQEMGGGAWKSKAVDNRSGCTLCAEAFLSAKALGDRLRLSAAFCVQEEVGGRGAAVLDVTKTVGRKGPDLAIVLDNVPSEGPEGVHDALGARIGAGPVLRRFDHSPASRLGHIAPPAMIAWVRETARSVAVPIQEDAFIGTFTDAATLSMSRPGGLPVVNLNLPRRYSHSPAEMFAESDLEALAALLGALIRSVADGNAPGGGIDYLE